MFKRIIIPVDLTDKGIAAVDAVSELAFQGPCEVTLLHVIETVEYIDFEELKDLYARLEKKARQFLTVLGRRFTQRKIPAKKVVVYGKRANAIVSFAEENNADLIVMVSHTADRFSYAGLATISYQVALRASCNVLLLK